LEPHPAPCACIHKNATTPLRNESPSASAFRGDLRLHCHLTAPRARPKLRRPGTSFLSPHGRETWNAKRGVDAISSKREWQRVQLRARRSPGEPRRTALADTEADTTMNCSTSPPARR